MLTQEIRILCHITLEVSISKTKEELIELRKQMMKKRPVTAKANSEIEN